MSRPSFPPALRRLTRQFIVNITSAVIHGTEHPQVYERGPYVLSKTTAALYYQLLSQMMKSSDTQIVTMEPGLVFNDYWKGAGCQPDWLNDSKSFAGHCSCQYADFWTGALSADFAVWAASKDAEFLHGRMVWCSWDVDELRTGEIRKRLDEDFNFLRVTVSGLKGGMLA